MSVAGKHLQQKKTCATLLLILHNFYLLKDEPAELTKAFKELVHSALLCVWQLLQILFHPLLKQACQEKN